MRAAVLRPRAAARQIGCLRNPLLPIDASRKGKVRANPADFGPRPAGDLVEVKDAEVVKMFLVDRTDAFDPLKIVGGAARRLQGERPGADGVGLLLGSGV